MKERIDGIEPDELANFLAYRNRLFSIYQKHMFPPDKARSHW